MKRILAAILATAAIVCAAAGCSADSSADSSDSASQAAEASPTRDTGEYYSTWTKTDWENATPEERELACIFLVEEAVASQGADEEVVQSMVDDAEETLTPDQYSEIEAAVTDYFDKAGDNANLQESLPDVIGTISKYVAIG